MAAMKLLGGVVAVVAAAALLMACGTSTPQPPAKFSPAPVANPIVGAKLQVAKLSWQVGQNIIFTGTGFNPKQAAKASVTQLGQTYQLGALSVQPNGSFTAVLMLPKALDPSMATLHVCAYPAGSNAPSGCLSTPITLRA